MIDRSTATLSGTRDTLAWTAGNGDPMHEVCIPFHGNSKGETRGRTRNKNNINRVVRNMKERNVGTVKREKSQTRPN